jgi:hypothetical protein
MEEAAVTTASQAPRRQTSQEGFPNAPREQVATAPKRPSTKHLQLDTALEYESMVLLSKIEQLGIRMNEPQVQSSTALALDYMVTITNHLVEFIDQIPMAAEKRFALDKLIARDWSHYTHLRAQHIRSRRLTVEAFKDLQNPESGLWETAIFQQLAQDLLRVHNICLNICVKAFHAPDMRQQWSKIYSGFLVHLVKAVKSVETSDNRS